MAQSQYFLIKGDCHYHCKHCGALGNLKGTHHQIPANGGQFISEVSFIGRKLVLNCLRCGKKLFEILMQWEDLDNEDREDCEEAV
jgi:DNA-directed RNA polymerase subunit RPC12/RpoP